MVLDTRCLYLALCHTAIGKLLEAAALLEMLTGRLDETFAGSPLPRLDGLFQQVQQQLPPLGVTSNGDLKAYLKLT